MKLKLQGVFSLIVEESGVVIAHRRIFNGITEAAVNDMFDIYFSNGSPAAAWYIGLIDSTDYSALSDEDTMASHSGWTEITTSYDESTRPAWGPDAAASQVIANATKATFTFNTAEDVKGAFIVSENTKGGTTGVLWSTGILDIIQSIQPGQTVKAYYSLTGQEG